MSRIGKKPINLPSGVTVTNQSGVLVVKGPLGEDSLTILQGIDVQVGDTELRIIVNAPEGDKKADAFAGLSRSLINNMVIGVSSGFEKDLEIVGVGYRAQQQSQSVQLQLGYSHPILFTPPDGITVEVVDPTKLKVKGKNKQVVGQVAANIRKLRPPEPYKGKGIRYKDEKVRKKAGKTGK